MRRVCVCMCVCVCCVCDDYDDALLSKHKPKNRQKSIGYTALLNRSVGTYRVRHYERM